ncbi:MAG: TauD/TfdA family dioxygenase [Gammaproteobacteria bacterium]
MAMHGLTGGNATSVDSEHHAGGKPGAQIPPWKRQPSTISGESATLDLQRQPRVLNMASSMEMSDLEPSTTPWRMTEAVLETGSLVLAWNDGHRSEFAVEWLRDNCACSACRHPRAFERLYMFIDHPVPEIHSAVIGTDGSLQVEFADGEMRHSSRYSAGWLRRHGGAPDFLAEPFIQPRLWGADLNGHVRRFHHDAFMTSDEILQQWIDTLRTDGIALLHDTPCIPGQLLQVARRIGPVRGTNFGDHYDVVSMPNPNAVAYTPLGLELHTDLANWRLPPDFQLLACLKSSVSGGDSVFADGFKVVEDLRREQPAAFHLLTEQPVEFRFHDDSCDIRTAVAPITLNPDGTVRQIRFNNWLRAANPLPPARSRQLLSALGEWWRLLRLPANQLHLRLEPGDLIVYHNHRVLHGRTPFDASTGERHLQGCYVELEDMQSTWRRLARSV